LSEKFFGRNGVSSNRSLEDLVRDAHLGNVFADLEVAPQAGDVPFAEVHFRFVQAGQLQLIEVDDALEAGLPGAVVGAQLSDEVLQLEQSI
jgi:hypothetical protein